MAGLSQLSETIDVPVVLDALALDRKRQKWTIHGRRSLRIWWPICSVTTILHFRSLNVRRHYESNILSAIIRIKIPANAMGIIKLHLYSALITYSVPGGQDAIWKYAISTPVLRTVVVKTFVWWFPTIDERGLSSDLMIMPSSECHGTSYDKSTSAQVMA